MSTCQRQMVVGNMKLLWVIEIMRVLGQIISVSPHDFLFSGQRFDVIFIQNLHNVVLQM